MVPFAVKIEFWPVQTELSPVILTSAGVWATLNVKGELTVSLHVLSAVFVTTTK